MYKDDANVVLIQATQLANMCSQISLLCSNLITLAEQETVDVDSMKAYIAAADIMVPNVASQQTLLQQALDKLANELAG